MARTILETALSDSRSDEPRTEAERQSRLASAHDAEADALRFITDAADLRGWK
jgi:hypothetical protein